MLLASEAHLSRMTAYELLAMIDLQNLGSADAENVKKTNPVWAIGWASKALIRYVTSYSDGKYEEYKNLVDNLIKYIKRAIGMLKNNSSEPKMYDSDIDMGIIKRAVIDILNALAYQDTLNTPLLDSNTINTLIDVAKTLSAGRDNIIDGLNNEAYRKSHYDIYLHSKEEQETFKTRVDFYASKIKRV